MDGAAMSSIGGMDRLGLDRACEGFEAPLPSPAGGSAAAASGAMAASLVVMVGRGSPDWPAGPDVSESAVSLRTRLLEAGAEDVEAVGAVLAAGRRRGGVRPRPGQSSLTRCCGRRTSLSR